MEAQEDTIGLTESMLISSSKYSQGPQRSKSLQHPKCALGMALALLCRVSGRTCLATHTCDSHIDRLNQEMPWSNEFITSSNCTKLGLAAFLLVRELKGRNDEFDLSLSEIHHVFFP